MNLNQKNKFIGFIYLIRLNNSLMGIFSVVISAYIANSDLNYGKVLLAIVTVFFMFSGGNIINDFFDIQTDKVNKPNRPLVSIKYNLKLIFILSIVFLVAGVIVSAFISKTGFVITLLSSILLFLYSLSFKRLPFIGNLVVSILTAVLFIFGAEAGGDYTKGIFPAIFSFLMNFGREILKDIEDVDGDEYAGMKTLPIMIGKTKSFFLAVFIYLCLIIVTFVPYLSGAYTKWYFFIAFFGVDIVLLVLLLIFYVFDDIKTKRFVNNYIKYDMLVGLFAIIMGVR